MAIGTATLFNEEQLDSRKGVHNHPTDTLKLVIIDNTSPPAADDATPRYSDYSANEVSNAGGYTTGGITLTTVAFAMVSDVATLTADDVSLPLDALGFTNGYWAILINDSATNKEAIGFWDLGGPVSEQAGPISLEFPAGVVAEWPANVAA
jgi:hypothetical protein